MITEYRCLTQRALDWWESARFLAFFAALNRLRFDGESKLQPIAANAGRWAARGIPLVLFEGRVELLQFSCTPCEYTACAFVKGLSLARPHLLRMVSRVTRTHASANAFRNHVLGRTARYQIAVQHSVHLTGGSLRVFRHFAWLGVDSDKKSVLSSRPPASNASRWAASQFHFW